MNSEFSNKKHKFHSESPSLNILQYLSTNLHFDSKSKTTDVILHCQDGALAAHQLILGSISPVLCSTFCQNKFEETLTIHLPDLSSALVQEFLIAVYNCQDLSRFHDINQMLGFQFASSKEYSQTDTIEMHSDNNDEMKEEADSEEDTFVPDIERNYRKIGNEVSELSALEYCHINFETENHMKENLTTQLDKNKSTNVNKKSFQKKAPDGKRRKRSKAWEYYVVDPSNSAQCICQICKEAVSYQNGGTSAMISHLKVDHGISVETISKKNAPIKRDKLKIKKEPTVDPETGEVKSQTGKSRKKRRKDLWQHFDHSPDNNLIANCKICQEVVMLRDKSSVSQTLVKHLNTHNIKLELETCSICGKMFDEKNKRRKHENNHQVKCSCSYCGKLFSDNTARIVHERTHTGEKPYQVCLKKFLNLIMMDVESSIVTIIIYCLVYPMWQEVWPENTTTDSYESSYWRNSISV